MAETNFRVFNEAMDPANTFNDSEYEHATQRLQGVTPGMALSRQHNKMYRQSSAMATAIANFIVSTGNVDCLDSDVTGITAGLALAINNIMDDGEYITLTDVMKRILVQSTNPAEFLEKGLFIQTSTNDSTSLKGTLKTKVGESWFTIKLDVNSIVGLSSTLDGYMLKTNIATQAEAEAGTENTKIMTALRVAQAITKNGVPVGTVINYASSMPPNGFLVCNGGAVSRTVYADLFNVIGTAMGAGNGSTTFNIPNLVDDRYIQGNSGVGIYRDAGLPNIAGQVGWDNRISVDNVLFMMGNSSQRNELTDGRGGNHPVLDFNASRYNAIYGRSGTVQPKSLTLLPCIKY